MLSGLCVTPSHACSHESERRYTTYGYVYNNYFVGVAIPISIIKGIFNFTLDGHI